MSGVKLIHRGKDP